MPTGNRSAALASAFGTTGRGRYWEPGAAVGAAAGIVASQGRASIESQVLGGAVNSASGQGVNIALGLQKSFNWAAVAASAVAAPIAQYAGGQADQAASQEFGDQVGGIASRLTSAAIDQTTYAAFTGGKINYAQIVADGFGNPIANGIKSLTQPQNDLQEVQVTAQKISADTYTAAGGSASAQDAPLTNNVDLQTLDLYRTSTICSRRSQCRRSTSACSGEIRSPASWALLIPPPLAGSCARTG